jgi:hypothetical protein
MPLAGSLDIRHLLTDAPVVTLGDAELHLEGVDILQVMYEVRATDIEGLVPPALNPTIPPVVVFLVQRVEKSEWGPFALVQARVSARAAVRPRAFLVSAFCNNPAAAAALSGSWGYRTTLADIHLRRFHDRVDCEVLREGEPILRVALVDPEPITGHDIQYPPGMHLALVEDGATTLPRIVQVDAEYEFHRADRGRPELSLFEASAWGDGRLEPVEPVSASFAKCDVAILPVRYICNPDIPAAEGTENVEQPR